MATITYTFVDRCEGGGHFRVDVSVNGAPARRRVFTTDELRSPLSEIADIDREATELLVLRVHLAGRTRQQIVTEFNQGPVTVTI